MPQRKKRTIIDEEIPAENTTVNDDLADFVIVNTKVYKLNAGTKSFCFQANEPVDEVYIQAQYPTGGKFVVVELNGLNQQVRVQHIDIEPRPLPATTAVGGNDFQMRMLMDELNYSRSVMLKMVEGMFQNRQQQATPIGELISAVTGLHSMTAPKNDAVDLIMKGMDLGIKANGGGSNGDWKSTLVETAKEVLPAAIGAMSTMRQPTAQPQQIPMVNTSPAAMVKQGIEWLKPKIISGMAVDLATSWVIQNNTDPLCQQLLAQAVKGDIEGFIQFDPEIANEPFRSWFAAAIQQLKDWYNEQQSPIEDDNDGGNGDSPDVASHAVVSVGKSKITKVS